MTLAADDLALAELLADERARLAELVAQLAELLADDGAQLAELVAERVAQLLRSAPAARFVDAATLADLLGVRRDWIYSHKRELGGFRLNGEHGRLRFDLVQLADRFAPAAAPSPPPAPARRRARAAARHRPGVTPVRLIPYHVQSAAEHRRPGAAQQRRPPGLTPGGTPDA
ncbi:MAG TPA: hypothetical protein VN635_09360 [Conexibacter sp.]|nr:hypothetical protein [Conexibacter sp.]